MQPVFRIMLAPIVSLDNHWHVDLRFRSYWNSQMSGGDERGLDLLLPVIEIHSCNCVLRLMVIRVAFIPKVFNLQDGRNSLRTEGSFVPSGTARDHPLVQVELISIDGLTHHLSQGYSWRVIAMRKVHQAIAVGVITGHVTVYGVLDGA